ncbi:hypothetical protein AAMO2058_001334400, partial [Amorphochlora amoebiformis]
RGYRDSTSRKPSLNPFLAPTGQQDIKYVDQADTMGDGNHGETEEEYDNDEGVYERCEALAFRVSRKGLLKECTIILEDPYIAIVDESAYIKAEKRGTEPKEYARFNLEACSLEAPCSEFPNEELISQSFYIQDEEQERGVLMCFATPEDFDEWIPCLEGIIEESREQQAYDGDNGVVNQY